MQVLSPYGKDVLTELKDIYGFNSVEATTEFVIHHLQQHYQFQIVSVKVLHVAFGLGRDLPSQICLARNARKSRSTVSVAGLRKKARNLNA